MINFNELTFPSEPFTILKEYYFSALEKKQSAVEAIVISSIGKNMKYADARYVNLKYVTNNSLIFFSNYQSNKASQFNEHKESMVSATIYWDSIDVQIRMRGYISKSSDEFSDSHFQGRDDSKNALAISSKQSMEANSYEDVVKNYQYTFDKRNLSKRPSYWGGYEIKPVYFEFWTAHKFRINKREVYEKINNDWNHYFLQP